MWQILSPNSVLQAVISLSLIHISSEKTEAPESFARKVNEICGLYQSAQEQSREGAHIVSTDEMTGVQALEHKYPDKLPLPGQCAKMELSLIHI